MIAKDLASVWSSLDRHEGGDVRLQFVSGKDGPALGVDNSGRRHLLFPIARKAVVTEDRRSSGVQIQRHVLLDERGSDAFVDVVCLKSHLSQLFEVIALEAIAEVATSGDHPDIACRRVLDRWRELLQREDAGLSGKEKLAGAWGELLYLRDLARTSIDCLRLWRGPEGGRHDFAGSRHALEVKTTLGRHGRFFEIAAHDQLEPPASGPLYLAAVKLEQVDGASSATVGEMAAEIAAMGVERSRLLTLLSRSGLQPGDLEEGGMAFRLVERRLYLVDDLMPKVTSASFNGGTLPQGVMRLRYLIDLTSEPPIPLSEAEAQAVVHDLARS